jgi:hypothetical protein
VATDELGDVLVGCTIRYGCILTPLPRTVPGRRIRSSAGPTTNNGDPGLIPLNASGDEITLGAPGGICAPVEHKTRAASAISRESTKTRRTCGSEGFVYGAGDRWGVAELYRVDVKGPAIDGGGGGYGARGDVGEETDSRRLRCQAWSAATCEGSCD